MTTLNATSKVKSVPGTVKLPESKIKNPSAWREQYDEVVKKLAVEITPENLTLLTQLIDNFELCFPTVNNVMFVQMQIQLIRSGLQQEKIVRFMLIHPCLTFLGQVAAYPFAHHWRVLEMFTTVHPLKS